MLIGKSRFVIGKSSKKHGGLWGNHRKLMVHIFLLHSGCVSDCVQARGSLGSVLNGLIKMAAHRKIMASQRTMMVFQRRMKNIYMKTRIVALNAKIMISDSACFDTDPHVITRRMIMVSHRTIVALNRKTNQNVVSK